MLTIEHVSKKFRGGNFGVRDLSLEVKSGVIGLLGPNGAGKTTLMQMVATITRPTSGRILFNGTDVVKRPNELRRKLGYLPQDFGVYDNLTARVFLTYFAALKGVRSLLNPMLIWPANLLVHKTERRLPRRDLRRPAHGETREHIDARRSQAVTPQHSMTYPVRTRPVA